MSSFLEKNNIMGDVMEDLLTDSDDELQPGWEMRVTDEGRVYYVDHSNRSTQWKHPKTNKEKILSPELPFGWERGVDESGKTVYIDNIEVRSTCIDPRIAYSLSSKKSATQKCDAHSTAMAVLRGRDMRGKTCLITGANSGIGFETALALSLHGCHVVMACRNLKRARNAAQRIRNKQKITASVDALECDLSSLESVRRCAQQFINKEWRLDILICNAAVMGIGYQLSADGIETTFATNHLGHWYLVDLLKDVLVKSQPSRVVVLAGESHRFPSLYGDNFDTSDVPMREPDYEAIVAYNQSKLCNILFAFELNRRMSSLGVTCNAAHPGSMVYTGLSRNSYFYKLIYGLSRPFTKSQAQGAATGMYLATSPEMEGIGGFYFNNCCGCNPSDFAKDESLAKRLWQLSERLAYTTFSL